MKLVLRDWVHQLLWTNNLSKVVEDGFYLVIEREGNGARIDSITDLLTTLSGFDKRETFLETNTNFLFWDGPHDEVGLS